MMVCGFWVDWTRLRVGHGRFGCGRGCLRRDERVDQIVERRVELAADGLGQIGDGAVVGVGFRVLERDRDQKITDDLDQADDGVVRVRRREGGHARI